MKIRGPRLNKGIFWRNHGDWKQNCAFSGMIFRKTRKSLGIEELTYKTPKVQNSSFIKPVPLLLFWFFTPSLAVYFEALRVHTVTVMGNPRVDHQSVWPTHSLPIPSHSQPQFHLSIPFLDLRILVHKHCVWSKVSMKLHLSHTFTEKPHQS